MVPPLEVPLPHLPSPPLILKGQGRGWGGERLPLRSNRGILEG